MLVPRRTGIPRQQLHRTLRRLQLKTEILRVTLGSILRPNHLRRTRRRRPHGLRPHRPRRISKLNPRILPRHQRPRWHIIKLHRPRRRSRITEKLKVVHQLDPRPARLNIQSRNVTRKRPAHLDRREYPRPGHRPRTRPRHIPRPRLVVVSPRRHRDRRRPTLRRPWIQRITRTQPHPALRHPEIQPHRPTPVRTLRRRRLHLRQTLPLAHISMRRNHRPIQKTHRRILIHQHRPRHLIVKLDRLRPRRHSGKDTH